MWFYLELTWKRAMRRLAERWCDEHRKIASIHPLQDAPTIEKNHRSLGYQLTIIHHLYRFDWSWVSITWWYRQTEYRLTHVYLTPTMTSNNNTWSVCGISKNKAIDYLKQYCPRLEWDNDSALWYIQKRRIDETNLTSSIH